jgi:hypothetical protein
MPLNDLAIRAAKPADKNYRLSDSPGLYLEVAVSGGKWWRFRYHFDGKEKRLSLGVYPKVGLKAARMKRDEARQLLDDGVDPGAQRKAKNQVSCRDGDPDSFESVAREWFARFSPNWAESHSVQIIQRLERDVFPWIGSKNAGQISPAMVLAVLRRIEDRGAIETAHRARENCSQVFRCAVATQRAERNPTPLQNMRRYRSWKMP